VSALAAADRRRALALMGVDVYVPRVRGAAAAPAEPPATAPVAKGAGRPPAAAATGAAPAPRVVFTLPTGGGFDGPDGILLRHIALAIGVDPRAVAFGAPRPGLPCLCFGGAPGDADDVLLAPPPAALRASAAARRALWPALRALARWMRG
jgi:hypothetical protein